MSLDEPEGSNNNVLVGNNRDSLPSPTANDSPLFPSDNTSPPQHIHTQQSAQHHSNSLSLPTAPVIGAVVHAAPSIISPLALDEENKSSWTASSSNNRTSPVSILNNNTPAKMEVSNKTDKMSETAPESPFQLPVRPPPALSGRTLFPSKEGPLAKPVQIGNATDGDGNASFATALLSVEISTNDLS